MKKIVQINLLIIMIIFACSGLYADKILDLKQDYNQIKTELLQIENKIAANKQKLKSISDGVYKLKNADSRGMFDDIKLTSMLRKSRDIILKIKKLDKSKQTLEFLYNTVKNEYIDTVKSAITNLVNNQHSSKSQYTDRLIFLLNERDEIQQNNIKDIQIKEVNTDNYKITKNDSVDDIMLKFDIVSDYEMEMQHKLYNCKKRLRNLENEINLNANILNYLRINKLDEKTIYSDVQNKLNKLNSQKNRIKNTFSIQNQEMLRLTKIKRELKEYITKLDVPGIRRSPDFWQ